MGVADATKTAVYNAIDNIFGSTITVNTITTTYNSRGDKDETLVSTRTVLGAYSRNFPFVNSLEAVGDVNTAGLRLYVKVDDNVLEGDEIVFEGQTYKAEQKGLLGFADVGIVNVFELVKKL